MAVLSVFSYKSSVWYMKCFSHRIPQILSETVLVWYILNKVFVMIDFGKVKFSSNWSVWCLGYLKNGFY
jgi:hypothetical protein